MKKMIIGFCLTICLHQLSIGQEIKKVKIDELIKIIDTTSVPLVVNFWASWCKPCIHEIPWFEKGVAAYHNKAVKMLLVSLDFEDDYPKKIAAFAKQEGYSSSILWLNETDADVFCPKIDKAWSGAIPVTLMVNNAKKYRKFYGQQITEPRFALALQELVQ